MKSIRNAKNVTSGTIVIQTTYFMAIKKIRGKLTWSNAELVRKVHEERELVYTEDDKGAEHVDAEMPEEPGELVEKSGVDRVDQDGEEQEDWGREEDVRVKSEIKIDCIEILYFFLPLFFSFW